MEVYFINKTVVILINITIIEYTMFVFLELCGHSVISSYENQSMEQRKLWGTQWKRLIQM